jgi:hypothetical protein
MMEVGLREAQAGSFYQKHRSAKFARPRKDRAGFVCPQSSLPHVVENGLVSSKIVEQQPSAVELPLKVQNGDASIVVWD